MKKFAIPAIAFAALLLVLFSSFLFDDSVLMLNSDQLNSLGLRYLRAEFLAMPQWDDSRLGGLPTLDAMFGDVYHPLVLTQWIFDPARAVGMKFILCVFIAFLSSLALFKKITGRLEWASLLAFLYALNPQFFTHIYGGHDGKMMVFSIAPLAVLGLIQIIRDGNFKGMLLMTASVVYMIVSSHIQLTYFFLWGAGLFTLFEVFQQPIAARARLIRLGVAAAGLALALGISSFQIIPPYQYTTQQSVRSTGEKTTMGHAVSWSLHQEELASMLVPGFLQADIQQEQTYWGHNSFKLNHDSAGALLTFLAFLGLFVAKNRRAAIFWFVGSAVALSYALGAHSPLFALWYKILPGVKNFRAPSMAIFWVPLAMAMMAAPVLDTLRDKESRARLFPGFILFLSLVAIVVGARFAWESILGIPGAILSVAFGAAVLGALNLQDRNEAFNLPNLVSAWTKGLPGSNKFELSALMLPFILVAVIFASGQSVTTNPETAEYFKTIDTALMAKTASAILPSALLLIIAVSVAFFVCSGQRALWQTVAILVIAGGLELLVVDKGFVQNVPRDRYWQPEHPVIQAIKADSPDPLKRPRLLSVSRNPALSGNIFPAYGMKNALGFHDNELATYREFRGGPSSENLLSNVQENPFLNLLNVGYIIFDTQEGTRPMRNTGAMALATLYGSYKVVPTDSVVPLLKSGFDYRRTVLLHEAPTGLPEDALVKPIQAQAATIDSTLPDSTKAALASIMAQASLPRQVNGIATLTKADRMDELEFDVRTEAPAILQIAGNFHPYWNASIDGTPTTLLKSFGTLRAVVVPAGNHKVVLKYESKAIALSQKISIASTILFLLVAAGILFRKKRLSASKV